MKHEPLLHRFGRFLLEKHWRLYIVTLVCALLPWPGSFLAAVLVGLATLQRGWKIGLAAVAWAALPAIALFVHKQTGMYDLLLVRCVAIWLAGLAFLGLRKSWSRLFEVMTAIVAIIVGVLHVVFPDISAFWAKWFNVYYQSASTALLGGGGSKAQVQALIDQISHLGTGLVGLMCLFSVVIPLIFARWWQTSLYSPGGLRRELVAIRVHWIGAIVLTIACLGLLFKLSWLMDLVLIFLFPFLFAGLSFLHYCVVRRPKWIYGLLLVYILLILVSYITGLVVAFVGYLDSIVNFRRRLKFLHHV